VPANRASALVWMSPGDPERLGAVVAAHPGLRWIQLPFAGVENFVDAGVLDPTRVWTCGKGVYADHVVEHAVGRAIAGLRDVTLRIGATSWGAKTGRSLLEESVVILGGGGICESLLRLLAPLRCRVTVVRRRPGATPLPHGPVEVADDQLASVLAPALVVFVAAALTPQTNGIIGAAELAAMCPGAWLVNVGRGKHVDTDALVAAIDSGHLGGAVLDVTEPEPLPDGHPLWSRRNVIITPHCANTPEMARPVLEARIMDNVRRFAEGDALIGLFDPATGY
jgi:phosphoglycerate dehydrogenase-like enzyme